MKIVNGIIFLWSGTHASIPSGWSRVTSMDDRYPKGTAASVNPNVTGGATVHSHVGTSHSHTMTDHQHIMHTGAGFNANLETDAGGDGRVYNHYHDDAWSGLVDWYSVGTASTTYGNCSNDPVFYSMIYITPTTHTYKIPAGAICLSDTQTPTGFNVCDGNNGTPNLHNKFVKGAGAGANAGTTGGSTTNTHALSHVHTTGHTHAAAAVGAEQGGTNNSKQSVTAAVVIGQGHSVALPNTAPNTTDNVSLVTTETVEPAYKKLLAHQAPSEIAPQYYMIAMWLGKLTEIPRGWILCDGSGNTIDMRDKHLKLTSNSGEVGNTGGSNTHTHASQSHTHTVSHAHSTTIYHSVNAGHNGSGNNWITHGSTAHTVWTDASNFTLNAQNTSAASSSNEPQFRTAAFIKLVSISNPGIILMKFFN